MHLFRTLFTEYFELYTLLCMAISILLESDAAIVEKFHSKSGKNGKNGKCCYDNSE